MRLGEVSSPAGSHEMNQREILVVRGQAGKYTGYQLRDCLTVWARLIELGSYFVR